MQKNIGQKFIARIISDAEQGNVFFIENESTNHLAVQYDSERFLQFAHQNKGETNWNPEQRFLAKYKSEKTTLIGLKDLPNFIFDYEMNCSY